MKPVGSRAEECSCTEVPQAVASKASFSTSCGTQRPCTPVARDPVSPLSRPCVKAERPHLASVSRQHLGGVFALTPQKQLPTGSAPPHPGDRCPADPEEFSPLRVAKQKGRLPQTPPTRLPEPGLHMPPSPTIAAPPNWAPAGAASSSEELDGSSGEEEQTISDAAAAKEIDKWIRGTLRRMQD
eukprot:TRINITY_DN30255_c0_g1_i2.p1 TRINITY_DN30255_c0_g1~~TRINITY_DN30255_c0_g1_i2.p1  ORF type:complete len:184 (+),score=44.75 TRINITY_DN30255_c0_g1_i2:107-658(+)